MKTIIAGSRTIDDPMFTSGVVTNILEANPWFKITEIVSGGARGVDQHGELLAPFLNVPVKRFPADWHEYGKLAGRYRNEQMAKYADALIAVWDGKSTGTKHMIETAMYRGLWVKVYIKQ